MIAWRDLRALRDPDRFDAWMNRVVTNVCIAQATRERRRTVNLRVLPVDGPAAPDDLLGVGDRDQLERGFRRLTPDERAILVLHHYAGYTLVEMAEVARSAGGHGPLPTSSRPPRHARRPRRRGPAVARRRSNGMTDDQRAVRHPRQLARGRPDRDARPSRRRGRRPDRPSVAATRVAPPGWEASHE